jgi:hypothetical protein
MARVTIPSNPKLNNAVKNPIKKVQAKYPIIAVIDQFNASLL